jgi:hypothetical protein
MPTKKVSCCLSEVLKVVIICGERLSSTWMFSEAFEVEDLKPDSTGGCLGLRSNKKLCPCSKVDVKSFERLIK